MSNLSLEQAPPWSVPFRFFLTAPLLGVLAGLTVAWNPELVLASRWTGPALAAVHLMTLGFMAQVMVGALLQFMPVAAGANVWRPALTATLTHLGLLLGTGLLVGGFLTSSPPLLGAAAVTLGLVLAWLCAILLLALARSPAIGPTLWALRVAVLGLVVTALLGVLLALALSGRVSVPLFALTSAHVAWGTLGWGLMLVAAVGWLVVPMFQLTPPYPLWFAWRFPWVVVVALCTWSAAALAQHAVGQALSAVVLAVSTVTFCVLTLHLQHRRKRRATDLMLLYWRFSMTLLSLAAVATAVLLCAPPQLFTPAWEWCVAAAVLAGVFPGVMTGMLYKIIPFLVWLHLKDVMAAPPTMAKVIPQSQARAQFWCFVLSVVLLLGAPLWPPLAQAGAAGCAISMAWLEVLLVRATLGYLRQRSAAKGAATR